MDFELYRKKVRGCFLGKAIGGTLGMPFEGKLETRFLTYYDPVPTEMLTNDDLDLQVINLEIVRRYGLPVNRCHLSTMWSYLQDAGPDEYGAARWNNALRRPAPLSGYYCNKFYSGMGAAIRSELWACLAPGDPALAVRLAREDACTDHYADGLHASVFLTAVESAAFSESDMHTLVHTGLRFLPENCRLARGLLDTFRYWEQTHDPIAAREALLKDYCVQNWTDVTINLCLILISWLASEGDFGRAICTAAGLGYDTDCTAATLGSIMGIIDPDGITEAWTRPIGEALVLSNSVMGMHEPDTIGAFCRLILSTAKEVLPFYGSKTQFQNIPENEEFAPMHAPWTRDSHAVDEMTENRESLLAVTPLITRLVFPEQIALEPGKPGEFRLILRNPAGQELRGKCVLSVPEGWKLSPAGFDFSLNPEEQSEFCFSVVSPILDRKRPRSNDLTIDFLFVGGVSCSTCAGIPLTIPWLRTNLDTGEERVIEATEIFQPIPPGHWRYRTSVKAIPGMTCRLGAYSNRPIHVSFNGKTVLESDGSYYVPAYHRSGHSVNITTARPGGTWSMVDIEIKDGPEGELFFGIARPHGCCEWHTGAEYSAAPWLAEQKKSV